MQSLSPTLLAAFIPLALGVLYGLSYAINGYVYRQELSLLNCMLVVSVCSVVFWWGANLLTGEIWKFPVSNMPWKTIGLLVLNSVFVMVAWGLAVYGMKHISPTFVAFGEISYVIFTPLFAYLIFGRNEIEAHTIAAGALILTGCGILMYGEYAKQATKAVATTVGAS
jgi:drug/metabolite transporter (DMT)-like permease